VYDILIWSPLYDDIQYRRDSSVKTIKQIRLRLKKLKQSTYMRYIFMLRVPDKEFEAFEKLFPNAWIRRQE